MVVPSVTVSLLPQRTLLGDTRRIHVSIKDPDTLAPIDPSNLAFVVTNPVQQKAGTPGTTYTLGVDTSVVMQTVDGDSNPISGEYDCFVQCGDLVSPDPNLSGEWDFGALVDAGFKKVASGVFRVEPRSF